MDPLIVNHPLPEYESDKVLTITNPDMQLEIAAATGYRPSNCRPGQYIFDKRVVEVELIEPHHVYNGTVYQGSIYYVGIPIFANTGDMNRAHMEMCSRFPAIGFIDCYMCSRKFVRIIYHPTDLHILILKAELKDKGIKCNLIAKMPRRMRTLNDKPHYEIKFHSDADYAMFMFHFSEHSLHHKNERLLKWNRFNRRI